MKKSNKEFVAEFMNQLDSGKLIQVIQGLLNQDEITVQNEPIVISTPEIVEETPKVVETNDSNITIEKLSVSEKQTKPNFMNDDDEKVVQWFAEKAKVYLDPKKPSEVPIEEDIYGKSFTVAGKLEAERLALLQEAENFAKLSPQEQKDALVTKRVLEEQELLKQLKARQNRDALSAAKTNLLLSKIDKSTKPSVTAEYREKYSREQEIEAYKAAEYRVDNNIPGKNFAETLLNDKVKNDRLAREINAKMMNKDYQDSVLPSLQAHIQEVQRKNNEYDAKARLQPQVDALEKELALTRELDDLLTKDLSEI